MLVRPVDAGADAERLYAISHPPHGEPAIWTYLPDGPYESAADLGRMLAWTETVPDALYFTLVRILHDWPAIRSGFLCWLAPENFDEQGMQRRPLGELIAEARR